MALASVGFHAEVAVDGGAAGPDDLSDVGWLEALGSQIACPLDVGMVGRDFPPACLAAVGGGDGHAGLGAFGQLVAFELGER